MKATTLIHTDPSKGAKASIHALAEDRVSGATRYSGWPAHTTGRNPAASCSEQQQRHTGVRATGEARIESR